MGEMETSTHISCLHEETTSATDHTISQEMRRKLCVHIADTAIRKWMKVK